jgi:hypothetical protein
VCAGALAQAQSKESSPTAKAQENIERVRELVQAGALPRVRLEQAERALAEAKDDEVLGRTLYGKVSIEQMSHEQAEEMIAAAKRKMDRQSERIAGMQKLVDEGVMAKSEMGTAVEDLETRKRTVELAESRAKLLEELQNMARTEVAQMDNDRQTLPDATIAERFDGRGAFSDKEFRVLETAFTKKFLRPLPVSAMGETATHRALGFDHRGRIDVAINPDQEEGVWLRRYLVAKSIPYFAFRAAIAGKATGPHIHLGPPSTRLISAD